jgi:hypothetical protein
VTGRSLQRVLRAVALLFMIYNLVTRHGTTGVTPAMAAGVTDRLWPMRDVLALVDARAAEAA